MLTVKQDITAMSERLTRNIALSHLDYSWCIRRLQVEILKIMKRIMTLDLVKNHSPLNESIMAFMTTSLPHVQPHHSKLDLKTIQDLFKAWEATWFYLDDHENPTYGTKEYEHTIHQLESSSMPIIQKIALLMMAIASVTIVPTLGGIFGAGVAATAITTGLVGLGLFAFSNTPESTYLMHHIKQVRVSRDARSSGRTD